MGFPALPASSLRQWHDGDRGTPDSASLWRIVSARNEALRDLHGRVFACWADGPAAATVRSAAITAAGTYYLGRFWLPPRGESTALVNVGVYLSSYASGGVTYYTRDATGNRLTICTPSGTGWAEGLSIVSGEWFDVIAVAESATDQRPTSVAIYTDQDTTSALVPAAWPVLSLEHMRAADRPDDVASLSRIVAQQGHVAGKRVRTLGSHSFVSGAWTGSVGGTTHSWHYRVARGAETGQVTFRVCLSGEIDKYATVILTAHVDGAAAADTVTPSGSPSATWFDLEIGASEWTANTAHDVEIRLVAIADPGETCAGTVLAICADEDAYSADAFAVHVDGPPLTTEALPQRHIWHRVDAAGPGAPIVASYQRGSILGRWTDRYTQAANALFHGLNRRPSYVSDWLWRATSGTAEGRNGTDDGYASATVLWRAKHAATRGAAQIAATFALCATGVEADRKARLKLVSAAAATSFSEESESPPIDVSIDWARPTFVTLVAPLSPEQTHEFSLQAGWVDANGNSAVAAAALCVAGVEAHELAEVPVGPADQYDYITSAETEVPPEEATEIEIACARTFTVRHLRLGLAIGDGSDLGLVVRVTAPGGSAKTVFTGTQPAATPFWISDAVTGDLRSTDDYLSACCGGTSLGTWTVEITQTGGGAPPTFIAYLEIA